MESIVILDFGSQYTQLIARRVRENRIFVQIFPPNVSSEKIKEISPRGIIFSGGPESVYQEKITFDKKILNLGIPILGICYGMQVIAHLFGGKIRQGKKREYGKTKIHILRENIIFSGLPKEITVWMSHQDEVIEIPKNFEILAKSKNSPVVAFTAQKNKLYGLQFHPEVVHTDYGDKILENFLIKICKCRKQLDSVAFINETIEEIKQKVNKDKVVLALSGGVDSSVCAVLLQRAIGENLYCIFVNTGLLRKNEPEKVKDIFEKKFGINLIYVDAQKEFLKKLKNVSDPERKRKIIGREFIKVFEKQTENIQGIKFLAQGTLYPDVVESISPFGGPTRRIKTHHNVGGLPAEMKLELIEPLRYLFKDEVRKVGKELKLPDEIINRHPFPGPGLAVRIIGPVNKRKLDILREADNIVEEEIRKSGLYEKLWQAFAVFLPLKSVGVMGDQRTYENVIALRIVTSTDAMTADWAKIPYQLLDKISSRIVNEVKGINRVVYDITTKPPATIEWE